MSTQIVSGISGLPIYAPSAGTAQYDEWGNRISSYYATVTDLDVLGEHVIEFNESAMDTRATVSANSASWGQGGGGTPSSISAHDATFTAEDYDSRVKIQPIDGDFTEVSLGLTNPGSNNGIGVRYHWEDPDTHEYENAEYGYETKLTFNFENQFDELEIGPDSTMYTRSSEDGNNNFSFDNNDLYSSLNTIVNDKPSSGTSALQCVDGVLQWGQGGGGGVEYLSSQASAVLVQGESSNRIGTFPRDLFIQGRGNTAGGIAMAQGSDNNAYGYSLAQGGACTASSTSLAQGIYCTARNYSVALGTLNMASATSFVQGRSVSATATSFAQGEYLKASSHAQVFGSYNNISSNAFVIADGSADTARHDAFVVYEGASPSAGVCSAKAFFDENGPVGGLSTASSNLPDGRTLLNIGSASFVYNPTEVEVGGGGVHPETGTAVTTGYNPGGTTWTNGPVIWDMSELTATYGTAASISGTAALDILIQQWAITGMTGTGVIHDQNISYKYTGSSISSEGNAVAHFTGAYTGVPYSASISSNGPWLQMNSAFATASITGAFAGTQKISACVVGGGPKYNEETFAGYWNGSSIYQVMLSAAWGHTTTGYLNTAILNGSVVSAFTKGAPVWIDNANSYTIHGNNYCGTTWFFGTGADGSREGSVFINNAANPAVYVRQFDNTTSNYSAFLVLKYPKA